jgi:hypothetical protein
MGNRNRSYRRDWVHTKNGTNFARIYGPCHCRNVAFQQRIFCAVTGVVETIIVNKSTNIKRERSNRSATSNRLRELQIVTDHLITSLVTIATAIIGVAIIAVLVSQRAQTGSVIQAAGQAFSSALNAAESPVTGSGLGGLSLNGMSPVQFQ